MNIPQVITLFGGVAMLLFGMNIMGDGLEKAAGDKLQKIIDYFTGNIFKGVFLGAIVTAIIQSSAATTVMTVGFVNAGIMSLKQAVGVIMGANIGTTMTSWIISLSELGTGSSDWMAVFQPKNIAPLIFVAGVVIKMFLAKNKSQRFAAVGDICIGFGLLFMGMATVETSVASLQEIPQFKNAFTTFKNPILGIIVGAVITAVIQSSSASVGLLQPAAASGLVTFSSAVPIIMGQNIGTCVTALMSAVGTSKNAKKTAMIHLLFNLIGTVVIMIAVYAIHLIGGISFWDTHIGMADIAIMHSAFNIINTVLLLPFANVLVKLTNLLVRGDDAKKSVAHLDERLMSSPSLALAQTTKEAVNMGNLARRNVMLTQKMLFDKDYSVYKTIEEAENTVDSLEVEITDYLSKILAHPLNDEQNNIATGLFHVVNDIERISDHSINIADILMENKKKGIEFSEHAMDELKKIYEIMDKTLKTAIVSYDSDDAAKAYKVEPLEEVMDELVERLRKRHMDRLNSKQCNVHAGIQFLDLLSNFERISDHCSNIGLFVVAQHKQINPHDYAKKMHDGDDENYRTYFEKYLSKYDV